jgi:hypothetical protein
MPEPPVLFDSGFIVRTPGAMAALVDAQTSESRLIERHLSGDFGELDAEDLAHNRRAVEEGGRIVSRYRLDTNATVWVITEANRWVTTVLLPDEY